MPQHAQQQSRLLWFLRTYYFRYHRTHCIVTTLMALLLGIVSTLFAATLGLAIYGMVFAAPDATIALVDLLGENYASAAQTLLGISVISTTLLTLYLPFFILGCAALRTVLMVGHVFMWERCGERVAMRVRDQLVRLFLSLDPRQRSQKKNFSTQKKIWPRLSRSMCAWRVMSVRRLSAA